MPEPEPVLAARGADVEPLMRDARAEIAQLSLQIRSVDHEADDLEAELASDDTSARDLLQVSLDELLEARRHELEQTLEQELVRAAAVVSAAQDEAARSRLEPPPPSGDLRAEPVTPAPEPMSPRRLQVVVDPAADGGSDWAPDAQPSATAVPGEAGAVVHAPRARAACGQGPQVPEADGVAQGVTQDAAPVSVRADEVAHGEAEAEPSRTEDGARATRADLGDIPADPALLRELVSAAVTAAVAQAISTIDLAGTRSAEPAQVRSGPEPTSVHTAVPGQPPSRPRPPFWRQLLHIDVLLPLVLVVIVFVVLLAWVG